MYSREFPRGNFLFFVVCMMSLLCLPCGKLALAFLTVLTGKDGRVECPCQTVDDFIGIGGSVCGLFLFVQTHAPLIVPPWQSRARKSKFQFHIRRKGAEVFHSALAAGGSLMAYKCLSLCRFRGFTAGFCKNFAQRFQKLKMRLQGKAKNFDLFRMRKKFRVQVERILPSLSHERFSIVEPVVQFEKLLGNIIVFINGVAGGFLCLLHRYFVRLDFLRLRHIILDFLKNFSLFFGLGLAEIFEKIIGNVQFLAEEPITESGRQFIRNVNAVGIVFCTAD